MGSIENLRDVADRMKEIDNRLVEHLTSCRRCQIDDDDMLYCSDAENLYALRKRILEARWQTKRIQ